MLKSVPETGVDKKTSEGIGSRNVIPRTIDGVSWDSLLMLTEKMV